MSDDICISLNDSMARQTEAREKTRQMEIQLKIEQVKLRQMELENGQTTDTKDRARGTQKAS